MAEYKNAIELLNTLQTPYETLQNRRSKGVKSTAQRSIKPHLEALGVLESLRARDVLHVAGTKGKGSVCAYTNAIVTTYMKHSSLPVKIGLHMSPHVTLVRERVTIDSEPISEEMFAKYLFEVYHEIERCELPVPTYGRFLSLMFFYICVKEHVDLLIVETGVGGKHDATNVFTTPVATAITQLGFDHVKTLGESIEEIAEHKAGIMKPGSPAYTVQQKYPKATATLQNVAHAKRINLETVRATSLLPTGERWPEWQRQNADLAMVLSKEYLRTKGLDTESAFLKDSNLVAILERARPSGRSEIICENNIKWCLDSAHTRESIEEACHWFNKIQFGPVSGEGPIEDPGLRNIALVFFHNSSRDPRRLMDVIHSNVLPVGSSTAIFCPPKTYDKQMNIADLTSLSKSGTKDPKMVPQEHENHWLKLDQQRRLKWKTEVAGSIEGAFRLLAKKPVRPSKVLVTGSIYIACAFSQYLKTTHSSGRLTHPSS